MLPLAGVLSPLACLLIVLSSCGVVRAARRGEEWALSASASGALVRRLRLASLWNAVSVPNALVAQAAFVPVAYAERGLYDGAQLLVLPLALIATKLLTAQLLKLLAASAGITDSVHHMLAGFDALHRWCQHEA